jgi:hypothetical protein
MDFSSFLDRRRQAVVVVFALLVAVTVISILSGLLELQLMNRIVAGELVSDSETSGNDLRQGLVGLAQLAVFIAAAVVFIRWLHFAYRNLDWIAPGVRRWSAGWAIGAWFVPFLNLWRPKQIFDDVWHADGDHPPSALPALWWTAFLITNWVANIALRATLRQDTPEHLRDATIANIVSDCLHVVTAVLAILLVQSASRRLRRRANAAPLPGAIDWSAPERPASVPPPQPSF